ncbi:MAG: hypothetical protein Q9164_003939 [Protoblastenia rupestris]
MAMHCLASPEGLKINCEKLAALGGFKNAKSANASWLVVKKKLLAGSESDNGATDSVSPPTAANETGNGTIADDEASPATESPKKKGGRKSQVTAVEGDDVAPEEDEKATPIKKRARKPKDPNATLAKRAKKEVKVEHTEDDTETGADAQLHGGSSIFGDGQDGSAHIKMEEDAAGDTDHDEQAGVDEEVLTAAI